MTSEAKRALSRTIRELRKRLLDDLGQATERAYRLSIDATKAALDEAGRVRRARLEGWLDEQARASGKGDSSARLRADVVKDAAATLLQRIVYLRLLEATGLRTDKVVTGGWESKGYKDFREAAPELVRPGPNNETEGYATLLQLVFDELALDLPGLYGPVRMTSLVPVPASTLRAVITALDDDELASVWTDDTTLGWIYQYWNDPEREALDAKLAAGKKLENHEIASKTQMFTERYMVEWLLHNSLGQMWLAMCRKHGWTADVERDGVLDRLESRRIAWRAKRDAGQVALDALMPIEPGLEDRWKYWVPQPMPDDAVTSAPDTVRTLKLLDPACGSGHFLVIACDLLFFLYQEEARHRGESWSDREIVESILENNLHGIDIDPRAVQIAGAALMLKARQLCADTEPRSMNLVAPNLSLSDLDEADPLRVALCDAIERETGIPPALTGQILAALAGADHLGTLLTVDAEIDAAIDAWDAQLSQPVADQGMLFEGFGPRRRKRITAEYAKATVLARLEGFLDHHTGGSDLGLRLRGEQLAVGVRFVRMVREGQYDLVIGNPPYQGTSKMANKAYIEKHYPCGKADLYAAFLERGLQLANPGGVLAMITMRNWLFLAQFEALRARIFTCSSIQCLADLGTGAFSSRSMDDVIAASCVVFRRAESDATTTVVRAAPLSDPTRDAGKPARRQAALLLQIDSSVVQTQWYSTVPGFPFLYQWTKRELDHYNGLPKLSETASPKKGLCTGNDTLFVRKWWEPAWSNIAVQRVSEAVASTPRRWVPAINGGKGIAWFEPLRDVVPWGDARVAFYAYTESSGGIRIQNPSFYMVPGIAFSMIGSAFLARSHRYLSVFLDKGSSIFGGDAHSLVCALNTTYVRKVLAALNPSMSFQVGDVVRVAVPEVERAEEIVGVLESAFSAHEAARESSSEFRSPGCSSWKAAQEWAQLAIDRPRGTPLPDVGFVGDPEAAEFHFSFAVGVALGRFDVGGEGILEVAPSGALPHGVLFLSDASSDDSFAHPATTLIRSAWEKHGSAIDDDRSLKRYLQERFFPDVHRKMYENRPIYLPLSSWKRSFVAFVAIHRWTATTLNDLLAEHLYPAKKQLVGEQTDLRATRDGADRKAAKAAEKRFGDVSKWLDELNEFIANVEQCAEKGPPPPDAKTKPREVDARYEPDLDDGVMINAAALWPLLEPQWKDPKKWWRELANAEGKKDYDWAHLAKRYFPTRVDAKCKVDPSLAVAHGCFWKYHPAKAYQWELRLQDEIRPDFTLDEAGSDAARAAFEADHADEVEALVTKEHLRRQRKLAKTGEATSEDEPQGELELDGDGDEELSA